MTLKREKYLALLWLTVSLALPAAAQMESPVAWRCAARTAGDSAVVATFSATIEPGWHVYSMDLPDGGPVALSVEWESLDGAALDGGIESDREPVSSRDDVFDMELSWWERGVTLEQRFAVADTGDYHISGQIRYMACSDVSCQAPTAEVFSLGRTSGASVDSDAPGGTSGAEFTAPPTWAPVEAGGPSSGGDSLWYIFLAGFLGGLVALVTPCVWPMIPLTVSYFLKRGGARAAVVYGVSIVVIYLALGLLVTAMFGASSLNALSTNAVFNVFFFILLLIFAFSFLGAFDISLPASWVAKADAGAGAATGLLGIFMMAFTLTLVSFSCTGPIVGTLLVEASTRGSIAGPAVGMGGFAIALALPFTLFAAFPSWLKSMPKSGGWLNTVKVTLGFVELALSLKFLSVADLAYGWGILDREVFVSLWVVIFTSLGLYLLGIIRLSHESPARSLGVPRLLLAVASLSFSVYLLPGLWGAPLKSVSAFVPPLYTQDLNLYGGEIGEYFDFDAGLSQAASAGKPALVDFSGYGCVNCRKMETAVLGDDRVRQAIAQDFVMIKLMVDDKTALPEPIQVTENGKKRKLKTVGDRWSYLQRHKFGANSQPYYVVLDGDGRLLSGPRHYDEDVDGFIGFLNDGKRQLK